ncbi:phospholipase C type enzyme [Collariella sp. IMI 366227]|nr:phospholipase C type enzyme [Collariella sp. IMI 366227]
MHDVPDEINLLTLNCWGLKFISKLRRERMSEIGRQISIANPPPRHHYQSIRSQTRFSLPYGKFYFSAALGGGLAILSRWPIEESTMYRYPLNGRPTAFWRGDWYVGKGIACAKIRYGPAAKQVVEVFNTHTHAPYEGGKPNDSYLCHRTAQSWEMAKLLRGAAEKGHLVLAMGDFNMIPMSLEHQIVTALAPVRDTWRVLHPDSSLGPATHPTEQARHRPVPTAEFNIQENGAASDGPYNTWRWPKAQQKLLGPGKPPVPVEPNTLDPRGKRLDYIFAGSGDIQALGGGWTVKRVSVGMTMRHPELGCSLSDHFAVEATLAFHPSPQLPETNSISNLDSSPAAVASTLQSTDGALKSKTESALHNGAYLQLASPTPSTTNIADAADPASQLHSFLHASPDVLPPTAYQTITNLIKQYRTREQGQQAWRGYHFFASVAATIACLVGVWFVPHNYISFILVLVSSLSLTAGTVDGLMSLLFFRSELKALREFEWEVRNSNGALGGKVAEGSGDVEEEWNES